MGTIRCAFITFVWGQEAAIRGCNAVFPSISEYISDLLNAFKNGLDAIKKTKIGFFMD